MYKKRIRSWGFDKKHKLHEVQAIIRIRAQRSAVGKRTAFYLRGRLVDLDDVERYLKRKLRSTDADFLSSAQTPPDLVYLSVPNSPPSPEKFRPFELFFLNYKNYLNGALDSKLWVNGGDDQGLFATIGSGSSIVLLPHDFCLLARSLFDSGYFEEAGNILRRAARILEEDFVCENPHLLASLILALEVFRFTTYHQVSDIFLEHSANLAAEFFAEGHPLRHICAALRSDLMLDTDDSVTDLFEGMRVVLLDCLGGCNRKTVELELFIIERRCRRRKLDGTIWELQQIKSRIEHNIGSGDARYMNILYKTAQACYILGDYTMAETNIHEMMEVFKHDSIISVVAASCLRYTALRLLSNCFYGRSDLIQAEKTIRESIKFALSVSGLENEAVILYNTLESWLREWGRPGEADEVRALSKKLQDEICADDDLDST